MDRVLKSSLDIVKVEVVHYFLEGPTFPLLLSALLCLVDLKCLPLDHSFQSVPEDLGVREVRVDQILPSNQKVLKVHWSIPR